MLALALFVCGFKVNAQRNANHNVMTSVEKQDVKKETRAPEVRVMDVKVLLSQSLIVNTISHTTFQTTNNT